MITKFRRGRTQADPPFRKFQFRINSGQPSSDPYDFTLISERWRVQSTPKTLKKNVIKHISSTILLPISQVFSTFANLFGSLQGASPKIGKEKRCVRDECHLYFSHSVN